MLLRLFSLRLLNRRVHHVIRSKRCLVTLAIESSCDDTSVSVVEKDTTHAVLHFNQRITANNGHLRGIHPIIALESHEENLAHLLKQAITHLPSRNGSTVPDFISVTRGPGMRSNLSVGLSTAKGLAVAWGVPLLGVHHMQAHALTPRLVSSLDNCNGSEQKPRFPFLSLLVSGGHTLLVRSQSLTSHTILATTTDIAIGDCLDKAARYILPEELLSSTSHTSYGSLLEAFAFPSTTYDYAAPKTRSGEIEIALAPTPYGWRIPVPLANTRNMQFSFSGIASYIQRVSAEGWDPARERLAQTSRVKPMTIEEARFLARDTMRAAFEHLASRVVMALGAESEPSQTLVVSGGVAANGFLRHVLSSFLRVRGFGDVQVMAPPIHLCTDNAAMIGWAGIEMYEAGFRNTLDIRAVPKWGLENLLSPEKEFDALKWLDRQGMNV
jgi:N6-L-threonylcarbamoyladenine synthase